MQERLQKVLARAGVASRRRAEELIAAGRVKVNDRKVTEMGIKVDLARDTVRVDGALIADIDDRVFYVLYKPAGCVTTMSDPEGRPTVKDWLRGVKGRVFPVGRLDYDAEGALIVTNDGELAHKLMHPRFGAQRTYLAKVKGKVPTQALETLREGVRLEDGPARPLEVEFVESTERNTWIRLVLDEGRQHLVKRLCEAIGHPVVRLFRASYAGIDVQGMNPGDLRELSAHEVKRLRAGDLPNAGAVLPPRRDVRSAMPAPRTSTPRAATPRTAAPRASAQAKKPARSTERPARETPTRASSGGDAPRRTNLEHKHSTRIAEDASAPAPGTKKVFVQKTVGGAHRPTPKRSSPPASSPQAPARGGKGRATGAPRTGHNSSKGRR